MVKELDIPQWSMEFRVFLARTGLNIKKVSEMTGISIASISSYTRGERKPSTKNCKKIKEAVGFDLLEAKYRSEKEEGKKINGKH